MKWTLFELLSSSFLIFPSFTFYFLLFTFFLFFFNRDTFKNPFSNPDIDVQSKRKGENNERSEGVLKNRWMEET